MLADDWIPHRRPEDRELLGWIRPQGERWVAVSLFGADVSEPLEWTDAEEALEARGLSWLAEPWALERDGEEPLRVRIVEVSPTAPNGSPGRVVVKTEDFGAIDVPYTLYELPWPPPASLRPARAGEGTAPWG
ncbi:hypothetical protein [Microbacterium album]|uniref:Uncharacterized protein n=1 Tax=Microbacterium album TaxID=2053191 RepID=A0A917IH77_9MICO|nr:hypothetical protein [Microbacterium album]GGH49478.1 hypothetical protein GCM10010921_27630 [Microbacterium album]